MYQRSPSKIAAGMTSGWHLHSIREMRGLSVQDLASATSLSIESIEAAEKDQHRFSVEEIGRLAVALDCHPSAMAFPEWDSIPYAPAQITVDGEVAINGRFTAGELRLFAPSGDGLWISGPERKEFKLYFFTRSMATVEHGSHLLTSDRRYTIAGSTVGRATEYFGGGAELHTDVRLISEVQVLVSPSKAGITYRFDGHAHVLASNVRGHRPPQSPPDDWRFEIECRVPASQLAALLGLYPSAETLLLAKLASLPN